MSYGSKKVSGLCPLCEEDHPLCNSHIVPEFCYKGMYDNKGRAIAIDTVDIHNDKFVQNGLKEYMLCSGCEGKINRYETIFKAEWLDLDRPKEMEIKIQGCLEGLGYEDHKLFHLSVLFRAHFSKLPNFSEVCLPELHINRLRKILQDNCAPCSLQYPIICAALKLGGRVEANLVGPAHRIRYEGHWGYNFTFAGGQWLYFISSHGLQRLLDARLREDGTLAFVTKGLLAMDKLYRPAYKKHMRSN